MSDLRKYKELIDGFMDFYRNAIYCYQNYETPDDVKEGYEQDMAFLQKHFPIKGIDWKKIYRIDSLTDDFDWIPSPDGWIRDFSNKVINHINMTSKVKLSEKTLNELIEKRDNLYGDIYESFEICSEYFIKDRKRSAILKNIENALKLISDEKGSLSNIYSKFDIFEFIVNQEGIDSEYVELSLSTPLLIELSKISGCSYPRIKLRDEYIKGLKNSVTSGISQAKDEMIRGF